MDAEEKGLMLEVMDGDIQLTHLLHQLSRFTHVKGILRWLLRNGFRGEKLRIWFLLDHKGSVLGLVKEVIKRSNNERQAMAIIYGKDYK